MTSLYSPSAHRLRPRTAGITVPPITANAYSENFTKATASAASQDYNRPANIVNKDLATQANRSLEERLFDSLAACKIKTRTVVMHFDAEWQKRFFTQLDRLLDKEEWDPDDDPVTGPSFTTLIRLLFTLRGKRRPALGIANEGNIVAAWSAGKGDRLTIECRPDDRVRWIVSWILDGERESAAGESTLDRLPEVLAAYDPEHWFTNEGTETSG